MNGSALVFDHGGRRIGVAVANRSPRLASPLLTLPAREGVPDWPALDRLVKEWSPGQLVVGVPYNGAGARIAGSGASETTDSESAAERSAARRQSNQDGLPYSRRRSPVERGYQEPRRGRPRPPAPPRRAAQAGRSWSTVTGVRPPPAGSAASAVVNTGEGVAAGEVVAVGAAAGEGVSCPYG